MWLIIGDLLLPIAYFRHLCHYTCISIRRQQKRQGFIFSGSLAIADQQSMPRSSLAPRPHPWVGPGYEASPGQSLTHAVHMHLLIIIYMQE